jgi:opacity protein-like surface antigen
MKSLRILLVLLAVTICAPLSRAAGDHVSTHFTPDDADAPSFEMATETAYMLGIINNPNSYEIATQFITARWRFGPVYREGFFRGYNQFYFSAVAEPIVRGPENFYYGISIGLRYNFLLRGSRFVPYVSGGVGLGWIDSHANINGAQGQDFTFNVVSAAGVSYRLNDHWKASLGFVFQHLSNGGQTEPNPSLNLFGPQFGLTYSW